MYTRELQIPRSHPIENGLPVQGTWIKDFDTVNLWDIKRPYSIPLPKWIINSRIKEWERFVIFDDRYCLSVLFCNLKFFKIASVIMHDRESEELNHYSKLIPGGGWHLPKDLKNASVDSSSFGFFIRIHSWLDSGNIMLDLDLKYSKKHPSLTAHAKYNIDDRQQRNTPMTVSLLFTERRSMYAYKVMAPVQGDIVFGGRHISLNPEKTTGVFSDYKGFFPYRMSNSWCNAAGFDQAGRRYGFSIAGNQAKEPFKNNENALWVNGKLTPLPPVKITKPDGAGSEWIIQDMEGMIDLTFTPKESIGRKINLAVCRSDYQYPIGVYNGAMVNAAGEEIQVRNLWGTGEHLYLRI